MMQGRAPPADPARLEAGLCASAAAAAARVIRERNQAPKAEAHRAAIRRNVERPEYQRSSVFWEAVDIEIAHHWLPLIAAVIRAETDARVGHRTAFPDSRLAALRTQLRTLVLEGRTDLAWNAYRDATEHVVRQVGMSFDYIEEELARTRDKLARTTPEGLFARIDEILQAAAAEALIAAA